jgi:hypothetical protein
VKVFVKYLSSTIHEPPIAWLWESSVLPFSQCHIHIIISITYWLSTYQAKKIQFIVRIFWVHFHVACSRLIIISAREIKRPWKIAMAHFPSATDMSTSKGQLFRAKRDTPFPARSQLWRFKTNWIVTIYGFKTQNQIRGINRIKLEGERRRVKTRPRQGNYMHLCNRLDVNWTPVA